MKAPLEKHWRCVSALGLAVLLVLSAMLLSACQKSRPRISETSDNVEQIEKSSEPPRVDKSKASSEFKQPYSLPRTGSARVIALHVTFPEYDDQDNFGFAAGDSVEALDALINKDSMSKDGFPYENLHDYYSRSSYRKLDISGDAFEYRAGRSRDYYAKRPDVLVVEALSNLAAQGVDLSCYDGNDDLMIDCVYLHVAGEMGSWGDPWWSATYYFEEDARVGDMDIGNYVILHRPSNQEGAARNMIHETGHALGLCDLYSDHRADQVAEDGSLIDSKSFGMMDTSAGDIDGYFKWYLGWIDDEDVEFINPVTAVELPLDLRSLSEPDMKGKKLAVIGSPTEGKFQSMYVIEYDTCAGNNTIKVGSGGNMLPLPDGFRIFKIDTTLNKRGFVSKSNSGSSDKMFELIDIDDGVAHEVFDGVPFALDVQYNCCLRAGQQTVLQCVGDVNEQVSAQDCDANAGRLTFVLVH